MTDPPRPGSIPGNLPGGGPASVGSGAAPASGPGPRGSGPGHGSADDSRAEVVLSQALRAMAGGQQTGAAGATGSAGAAHDPTGSRGGRAQRRLTTGQLLLLAAIVGLLIGIGAGLLSLLL